ncbi:LOW QUALITY PROTEIN: trace amine-associated receptor 7c-like [Anabas testudineus]|uniref:LOW QUALITY PROTEIN: trace amine-associated receptor 7c-like n=1 Tax=Anabas testudineus TaxID=64144 RepID=UPI000E45FC8E|nr:LOW QUALITY PROTEIN: trace amine-associated receptor 7c-like [Anabas testudineus]
MDGTSGSLLCFPNLNSSCRRLLRPPSETALLYTLFAFVSLLTVALNSLIIFSISHFRQLHTPTNNLLQSLAVCDLLIGLLVMPIEGLRYIETCWLLGRLMCAVTPFLFYCLVSTSLGHMVLISIIRYVTICDPLLHTSKLTITNVNICIFVCWAASIIYNGLILMEHMGNPERLSSCYGECVVVVSYIPGTVDLFITFVAPCTVMVVLYMKVFVVAVSQARVIQSQAAVTNAKAAPSAKNSQRKAARTLGILIVVFLMCYCPYYYPTFAGEDTSTSLSYYSILIWIELINSCLNPLIYALFYPWFRKAIKLIFTLRVLQAHSREIMIM